MLFLSDSQSELESPLSLKLIYTSWCEQEEETPEFVYWALCWLWFKTFTAFLLMDHYLTLCDLKVVRKRQKTDENTPAGQTARKQAKEPFQA